MSATITSQTKQRPSRHEMRVRPSCRLPSDLSRPAGSFVAGILALVSERSTMSLRWLCRVRRPEVCLHDSACDPLTSTTDPHIHTCGSQMLMPRRRSTAILTTSSSNLNPQEEMGMACSQSPLCLLDAASSRALSYVSVWRSMSWESSNWTIGLSQICCLTGEVNVGMSP